MSDPRGRSDLLAIMITDVEGSTALRRSLGDSAADEILGWHEATVRAQVATYGGREHKSLGDGFLLSFPTAAGAVRCAVGIQLALAEHNRNEPERAVRVRIGVHSGRVRQDAGDVYGQAVHVAARIAAKAVGGQILVSGEVREEAAQQVTWEFTDSGLYWLKGFPERWRLYQVTWTTSASARSRELAPSPTPVVERDAERADLRRAVDEALAGHGRLAVVTGEAGVGKSRLVGEVAGEAQRRGLRILTGHCLPMDGAPPYLPYVEIIEEAAASPRSSVALREALGDVAPEIARIAPALRRVFPDIASPVELPPELARRYLWNSFSEFLARAADPQPLVFVLEDLHWADESTLLLTEYLAPLVRELPVLILGTYRHDEVATSATLPRVISQLERRRLVDRIRLRRLSSRGVSALIQALAGQVPSDELVQVINSETEGNPFFVEEVYLHLAESGVLFDEQGRLRSHIAADEVSVPESVRVVLGERLDRLSDSTREALVAAAVSGRTFTPDLVAEVAGLDADTLLEAFEQAETARLMTPARGSGEELVFSHELIRQTLLADLSTLKRERLHLQVATAIERRYRDGLEAHAADLAYHLSQAGRYADRARLAEYLTIAGDHASQAAAFDDALGHFEHALSLLDSGAEDRRAGLLERLAMTLRNLGRWDEALLTMNEALDTYQALGDTRAMGRLSWAIVYQLTWSVRVKDAVQAAQRGLEALGEIASADRARLLSAMAWAVSLGGDHARATAMFEQARTIAEEVADAGALANVLHMQTYHHLDYGEFTAGVQAGLRAEDVFDRERAVWDLCSLRAMIVYLDGALGSRRQATRLADATMASAERLGHLGAILVLLLDRARLAVTLGELASVEAFGSQIVDICERADLPWLSAGHLYQALAAHWRGDAELAEQEFGIAIELEPAFVFAGQSASLLARHLAQAGRVEEVRGIYESTRQLFPSPGAVNSLGSWNTMAGMVEALYLSGLVEQAAALSPLLDEALALGEWLALDGRLVRTRAGVAAAAGGRWDDAERHYTIAQQHAERMHNALELADLRRLHARMLLDRQGAGDRERAAPLLQQARADYLSFGMPTYVAEAERMLREAGDPVR